MADHQRVRMDEVGACGGTPTFVHLLPQRLRQWADGRKSSPQHHHDEGCLSLKGCVFRSRISQPPKNKRNINTNDFYRPPNLRVAEDDHQTLPSNGFNG